MNDDSNLSVESLTLLICTYNGRNKLEGTLQSIAELKVPKGLSVELLIVDNNSNDGTNKFLSSLEENAAHPIRLKILSEARPGKSNALITGFNHAQGDIIILCDDDNHLDNDYLILAFNLFKNNQDIGLAGGHGRKALFTDGLDPEWFDRFKWRYMVGTHHQKSGYLSKNNYTIYGAGSIIRKSVWNLVYHSGFRFQNFTNSNKAMAEDLELAMAVAFSGNKLYFNDQLTFVHDLRWGRLSIEKLKQQEKLNGKCNIYPIVYELIYHRIGSSFLFLRFLKHYLLTFFEIRQQLQKLRVARLQSEDIVTEVDFVKVKSTYKNMVIMLPIVIFKYPTIKRWIQRLVEHSKAL